MGLTVTTAAPTRILTTRAKVQAEVGISTDGTLIDALILAASSAIEVQCHRRTAPFARQAYVETIAGYDEIRLLLSATPLVVVSVLLQEGAAITDYTVDDAEAGMLYRRNRFAWTAQRLAGLGGRQEFPLLGTPIPRSEEPSYTATYVGGYLLPAQNVTGVTISAAAGDNSFNDSASGFPALLQAGDTVVTSGFVTAANNGTFTVTGTPTRAKIPVTATLVTEAAAPTVTVTVSTLPPDLEKACIEAAKAWYQGRARDPEVIEEQVGDMSLRYRDGSAGPVGLPPLAACLIRPWLRAA